MSTYYHFVCKECNEQGGFLSRQAWGTGNFDIIETFKFLAVHKDHKPILHCEHDDDEELDISRSKKSKAKFVEDSKGMMPHSNEWSLVKENDWSKVEELWEKDFMEGFTWEEDETPPTTEELLELEKNND